MLCRELALQVLSAQPGTWIPTQIWPPSCSKKHKPRHRTVADTDARRTITLFTQPRRLVKTTLTSVQCSTGVPRVRNYGCCSLAKVQPALGNGARFEFWTARRAHGHVHPIPLASTPLTLPDFLGRRVSLVIQRYSKCYPSASLHLRIGPLSRTSFHSDHHVSERSGLSEENASTKLAMDSTIYRRRCATAAPRTDFQHSSSHVHRKLLAACVTGGSSFFASFVKQV